MNEVAIRVEKLGRRYSLCTGGSVRYRTLREDLVAMPRRLWSIRRRGGAERDEFWALRDVSFEVHRGEVLGVIGRNGAGKSTLLKILSRIVDPSEGAADLYGRVGSLLEVGTGFHPELTGRENIYLSGAILGLRRAEVRRRFDEIVAFADVERFLETPCKHFSSGMYMRLAFAVAAHLDTEILLVDEVLAVGDAEFQRKCIGKMDQVVRHGRTVLFVSHNLAAVQQLCSQAILLQSGRVVAAGETASVVESYRRSSGGERLADSIAQQLAALPPDANCELTSLQLEQNGTPVDHVGDGEPLLVRIGYRVRQPVPGLRVYFDLIDENGMVLIRSFHDEDADTPTCAETGDYVAEARLLPPLLAPRNYELRVRAAIYNVRTCQGNGIGVRLQVHMTSAMNRAYPGQPVRSLLRARVQWTDRRV